MKSHTQHIELINNYLNNLLPEASKIDFESKLQQDTEFKTIYEEHLIFLGGLNRIAVKNDIHKAKQSYITEKWVKISGITIIVIGALLMLYTLLIDTPEIEPISIDEPQSSILSDRPLEDKQMSKIDSDTLDINSDSTASQLEVIHTTTRHKLKFGETLNTKIELKKPAQVYDINTSKDTVIRCQEGTIIKIKAGSFAHPISAQTITGDININVSEYFKLSDILLANLSTVSHGKLLETGGMLYIEAKQGEIDLKIKDDSPIDILFPTQRKKTNMQLFSGRWDDNNINWTLQNDLLGEIETIEASDEIIEETIDVPFNSVEQAPTFPGCEFKDNDTRKACTTDAISKFINRNFNTNVSIGLGLTGIQRIHCIFKIDIEGNIAFIQTRAQHPRLSREADRVINMLPKMIPGMQRGKRVNVPYSLPITFRIEGDQNVTNRTSMTQDIDSIIVPSNSRFSANNSRNSIIMDTIYRNTRGIQETIKEIMHDKDFVVDSKFLEQWQLFKKQRLIREINLTTRPNYIETAVILRKPLFEMEGTRFKILKDDSISRGGHIIRIPWDETQIPSRSVMKLVPKQTFSAGNASVTAEEFESRLSDETDSSITSKDLNYYVLKSSNLGWINCDRFINSRAKKIKYKLKIKNAEDTTVSMVFKSSNSVLPSWKNNDYYDFQTVSEHRDVILVAIKRDHGKLYIDTIETKTEEDPQINFEFKEVTVQELKTILEQLNDTFE
ncbi:energy transducer TonB [Psychroserpens sp. MEBiC05023]